MSRCESTLSHLAPPSLPWQYAALGWGHNCHSPARSSKKDNDTEPQDSTKARTDTMSLSVLSRNFESLCGKQGPWPGAKYRSVARNSPSMNYCLSELLLSLYFSCLLQNLSQSACFPQKTNITSPKNSDRMFHEIPGMAQPWLDSTRSGAHWPLMWCSTVHHLLECKLNLHGKHALLLRLLRSPT